MYLTEVSIRRPVVSWVLSLILIVFGVFVFWKLPVRELPSGLQPPVVQVKVEYKSASAPIIDEEVTQVIEDVIGGAEGIKNIDSKSENGKSTINVEFDTEIDLDDAANDIRERVARVVDALPSESKPPQILKQAAGFSTTMWLALSSPTWNDLELGDYAERYLVDKFSSVKNVGRILVGGLRELSVRVWIDPVKLAANNLTIQEVEQALRNENLSLPAGTLEANNKDLTINLDKSYNDLSKLKQLPIKKGKDNLVRLSDVANVEFGPVSEKALFRAQSKKTLNLKTVGIGIYARSGASTVELSKEIKKKVDEVKKTLPAGLNLEIAFNRATYIAAAINEVYKTLIIAFILVVVIIYLFLGNLKAVIVPAIALPVSLISTFLGIYLFGLSINIFVLLSFILAIGIITDDSVIMTDAIYRRIENGESPLVAAYKGSKQITFAIIATTLILVAVFLPLIFIEGIAGTLFKETAIALSFAIVVSSFVALTLSPMLGSKFLDKKTKTNFFVVKFDKFFKGFSNFYQETLKYWLDKKKIIITFIILIIISSGLLYNFVKKELLPMEDRGTYLVIGFTDEGSSFQYTKKRAEDVEKRLIPFLQAEDSPYDRFLMIVPGFGGDNSFIIISLLDNWKNRKQNSQIIMRQAIGKIVTVPQAVAFPISPQAIRVSTYNKPVQMVILGSSYEELENIQSKVIRMLRRNKDLSRIESDYSRNKPEVKLVINKNKAKDLAISILSIGQTLETLYGGKTVTKFNKLGKEYPIILQQYLADRKDQESISKIFVRSENTGKLISLANLVNFKEEGSASKLSRYNRQRAVTISANISENYTLSEAIKYFEKTIAEISPGSQVTWKGKSEELKETSNELYIIFALALLTAYLVMAATFNSFVHPFIIVLTVPLAVFGGLVFILFFNSSVNIFSQIALVILIGISTKNSILIVEYANQLRTIGKNIENSVKEACELRFRPIIMTSLSTMIAMIPLIIGNIGPGAGEASRLAVGSTILGGMIISTFFTLYVTPTMYVALAKNTKRIDAIDIELKKQLR
ncbi:MAG TPA: efflux RND transporter permease subunit [Candidatus Pelagibacter bacterium]|jgi:HAE1 family hydrophobic/amphiphilic exporter-1/multidrug efflux pump|nr:multidrug transporter AcrB [Flavobacteriaceae bacterium]HJN83911.1 efflux RND transporter permease subunit [Candidatus Pelagibacter bacterium]|tara:strand:+ start:3552 stop:6662 length:3111 start_codon:yes stop_codon:yes gene_type:complete